MHLGCSHVISHYISHATTFFDKGIIANVLTYVLLTNMKMEMSDTYNGNDTFTNLYVLYILGIGNMLTFHYNKYSSGQCK